MAVSLETIRKRANDVADVARTHAAANDAEARFPEESVRALGDAGMLGLIIPEELGGLGLGPAAVAEVVPIIAEADASLGMIYVMHLSGVACLLQEPKANAAHLQAAAKGDHLSTLAFSEKGSRSHFWAPVSKAHKNGGGVLITAEKSFVTSAGHADSYIVTTLAEGATGPTDTTLYRVDAGNGYSIEAAWDGLGLRANASAPMHFKDCKVDDAARLTEEGHGFAAKIGVVLPYFNLGSACVSLGIARAAVAATTQHLATARLEHMGTTLGETLPTLRANLARMGIQTDAVAQYIQDTARSLEAPDDSTQLKVLQVKALANEAAVDVAGLAMRTCGGAAFAKHLNIERSFRDAQAGAVMAPTADALYDLLGKARLGLPLF